MYFVSLFLLATSFCSVFSLLIIFYLCRYLLINFFLKVIFFLSNAELIAICSFFFFLCLYYLFSFSFFPPSVFQHFCLLLENSFSVLMFPFCGSFRLPLSTAFHSFLAYLLYYQNSHIIPFHSLKNADPCLLSATLSFLGSFFFLSL